MYKGILAGLVLAVVVIALALVLSRDESQSRAVSADSSVSPFQMLGELGDKGFEPVRSPWVFRFPPDHGAHSEYRTESWYLSGVLTDERQRQLGVQFVVMRIGLAAPRPERASKWAASEIYAGLFSISDPADRQLRTDKRVARGALDLAGARATPVRIWVEDWQLVQAGTDARTPGLKMRVAADEIELDLDLKVVQSLIDANQIGEEWQARTAPFRFYLVPRMSASGALRMGGQRLSVSGNVSMEHAWGELPLPGGPVARDRFTLFLDDRRVLFCIRTHRVDGSGKPTTVGLLIDQDGQPRVLLASEIKLEPKGYWVSERTGARYPIGWELRVPNQAIALELIPHWEDQEGIAWAPFWTGPVHLQGTVATYPLSGEGLVQLSGYNGS